MDQGLLESWSGPNSNVSESQDQVRMTLLTTIGGQTLPNPVRVPDSVVQPRVLRLLIEGPLRPWQFLMYANGSLPLYKDDPTLLFGQRAGHTLLQIGLAYEDLDRDYQGGEVAEDGRVVEIENVE